MRRLYSTLLYLATPLVLLRLLWRGLRQHDYWYRWGERFGLVQAPAQPVAVWVHAVSVGESLAALPLIKALMAHHGEGRVWVTTTTPTGSARIVEALGKTKVRHSYAPYDLPGAVSRFLDRLRPQQVIVMETELWPNLFHQLAARRVPLFVANARLSPHSFKGYSRVRAFAGEVLSCCTLVAAQSQADAERFAALGAPRVSVMGNIKFDLEVPAAQAAQGRALRATIGHDVAVWIAASTHEGEEELALRAHLELRKRHPGALLVLVPRHPQRFDHVQRLIERSGLNCDRRSALIGDDMPRMPSQVMLGDSMGEIFYYFAIADVAFVGGSLTDIGGHNVLEPAAAERPVVFGPYMYNFAEARQLLLDVDAAVEVADVTQLVEAIDSLLKDPARRQRMGAAGSAAVAANRGALQRLLQHVGVAA